MKNTTNYSLLLPDEDDFYSVGDMNANMEAIDARMKSNQNIAEAVTKNYDAHASNKSNPHGVTKAQVGLSNVPNVSTNNQTPTYTEPSTLSALVSGELLSVAFGKIAKAISSLISHLGNVSNPHAVTKAQIGLGNVPNVATNDQTPTYSDTTTLAALVSGEKLNVSLQKIKFAITTLISHIANTSNPHTVTKSQVGLGNCDNTSDANKPVSSATQTALNSKVDKVTGMGLSTNDYTAAEKTKLAGIATGAQVNSITGVKGNAETSYRTGQVNITPANIGLGNVNNTADSAKNVLSATKLTTSRTISLTGDVTGSVSFDGSSNVSITTTVVDSSHNHNISNVSGLQVALDDKVTKGMFGNGRMRFQWVDSSSQLHLFIDDTLIGKVTVTSV